MKDTEKKPETDDKKVPPSSGLFGFAGTTLFQPGQSGFKGEGGTLPFTPDKKN